MPALRACPSSAPPASQLCCLTVCLPSASLFVGDIAHEK
jgi:hypothetical protein